MKQILLFLVCAVMWGQYTPPSGGGGSGAVSSVFSRTGAVTATSGDYTAAQVTNAADTTATYSNPGWITALAATKLTGTIDAARLPSTFSIAGPITLSGSGAGQFIAAAGTTPSAPSAGTLALFFNSGNSNHLSVENSAGAVTDLQAGSGGMTLISNQVLGSAAATVSFNSLGSYTNLRLVIVAACSGAVGNDDLFIQVNGDTGSNYSRQYLLGNQGTASAGQTLSAAKVGAGIPCASAISNNPASLDIIIPAYSGTTFLKLANITGNYVSSGSTNSLGTYTIAWKWNSTSAITSILLGMAGGSNFVTGSSFSLYGMQ